MSRFVSGHLYWFIMVYVYVYIDANVCDHDLASFHVDNAFKY